MTDSEIIKALERCRIPLAYKRVCNNSACKFNVNYKQCNLDDYALDLIKRQQEEIEKAKSEAVREFAEKLKECAFEFPTTITFGFGTEWVKEAVSVIEIDNLVKEMGCDNGDI